MTTAIKIGLKNRPESPYDFPHKCFEMSWRIQAALDVMVHGAEPWEQADPNQSTHTIALHLLVDLVKEAKDLVAPKAGSPYDSAVRVLLGTRVQGWQNSERGREAFWPEFGSWLEEDVVSTKTIEQVDRTKLVANVAQFIRRIETMGLYFWRMFTAHGKILPDEVEIRVEEASDPANSWMGRVSPPNRPGRL